MAVPREAIVLSGSWDLLAQLPEGCLPTQLGRCDHPMTIPWRFPCHMPSYATAIRHSVNIHTIKEFYDSYVDALCLYYATVLTRRDYADAFGPSPSHSQFKHVFPLNY